LDDPRAPLRIDTAGGSLLDEALAKRADAEKGQRQQTYREHVVAVYRAWCGLVREHAALIESVAARCRITSQRLRQSSLLCVSLHDVGKLTKNFQDMMREVDDAYKRAMRRNYRHEIAGIWVVKEAARALSEARGEIPGGGILEALAVAGHHRFVSHDLPPKEQFVNAIAWVDEPEIAVEAARDLARAMFVEQGWTLRLYKLVPGEVRQELSNGPKGNYPFICLEDVKSHIKLNPRKERFHELFTLVKGLLMTADWMASGAHGEDPFRDVERGVVRIEPELLHNHLRERHARRRSKNPHLPDYKGFTPFQGECATADGHILGVAPTGSGKTEAALAWALRQIKDGHARKILFLLPTMVTANSIQLRMREFFDAHGHKVGLVHSTADLVRDPGPEEQSEADRADVRAGMLQESHFFFPVTVGTVDQLLVPLFHAGRWALKKFAAADSAIIIDEVHAYEPHTLGLIVTMIRQFRHWGARFFVMSATMPSNLRAVLLNALRTPTGEQEGISIIEEKTLLEKARNDWKVCEAPLSEWLLEGSGSDSPLPSGRFRQLWGEYNDRGNPMRILIVVNTVEQCQRLATALRKYNPVCYHSKFIFKHRTKKERQINDCMPRLLIATQVVEVSLDIDYDVLLTECAPFDALVQRAGRVNRARLLTFGRVIVYRHEKKSERVYAQPAGILDCTWALLSRNQGLLTERRLIELVEEVYQGLALDGNDAFRRVQNTIRDHQDRLAGVLDAPRPWEDDVLLKTRPDDYPQLSVIPHVFADRVKALAPRDRRLYELKMPIWYTRHNLEDSDGIPFCRMKYGVRYGARFSSVPGHPEPSCEVF
jgi:CRISPR-associated endonuclease/helicase Cas3